MINKNIRLVPVKQNDSDFTEDDLLKAPDAFFLEIKAVDILESTKNKDFLKVGFSKIVPITPYVD